MQLYWFASLILKILSTIITNSIIWLFLIDGIVILKLRLFELVPIVIWSCRCCSSLKSIQLLMMIIACDAAKSNIFKDTYYLMNVSKLIYTVFARYSLLLWSTFVSGQNCEFVLIDIFVQMSDSDLYCKCFIGFWTKDGLFDVDNYCKRYCYTVNLHGCSCKWRPEL